MGLNYRTVLRFVPTVVQKRKYRLMPMQNKVQQNQPNMAAGGNADEGTTVLNPGNSPFANTPPQMQQNAAPAQPYQNNMPMQQPYQNGMPGQPYPNQNGMPGQQQYYAPPRKIGYCRNCGEEMFQGRPICTKCGTRYGEGAGYCHSCGAQAVPGSPNCTSCGKSLKPPVTAGNYFKGWLNNFIDVIKNPDLIGSIARHFTNLMAIVLFIVMFLPIASCYNIHISTYSLYQSSLPRVLNVFGLSAFGGVLIILAFILIFATYEPFARSFLDNKNKTLSKFSVLFVPVLDTLGVLCVLLEFFVKSGQSSNSYLFVAKYPELHFTIIGYVFFALAALSLVAGVIALIRRSTVRAAVPTNANVPYPAPYNGQQFVQNQMPQAPAQPVQNQVPQAVQPVQTTAQPMQLEKNDNDNAASSAFNNQ